MSSNPLRIIGADGHLAGGLQTCIINDADSVRNLEWIATKSRALVMRAKRGTYDPTQAAKVWRYQIENFIPRYRRDPSIKVDIPTRNLAGRLLEQYYRDEVYQAAGVPESKFPEFDRETAWVENGEAGLAPTLATSQDSGLAPTIGG